MSKNVRELRSQASRYLEDAHYLIERAQRQKRDLTDAEEQEYDRLRGLAEENLREVRNLENFMKPYFDGTSSSAGDPNPVLMGDNERALANYIRFGDLDGLRDMNLVGDGTPRDAPFEAKINIPMQVRGIERRANDTIMNITTEADGGAVVPTGLAPRIAARRNGIRISERLGVQRVPGIGTTVNHPYENADPNEFATTSEQVDNLTNTYERDAPVLAKKALTLVKKTKKLVITEELSDDEDANLLAYIGDHIGRAVAITQNAMLLAEVAANGSTLKTFAAAAAIAAGEPEDIVYGDTLGYYLDELSSVAWVMRPSTFGAIKSITGDDRQYGDFRGGPKELLEYPVVFANAAAAIGASAKSIYFGNWSFVGMREDPSLRLIRDPFSVDGAILLKYSFRCCFGILQAGACGFAVHPSA